MASNYYNQVIDILKSHGFSFLRAAKGSHQVWVNSVSGRKVSVPAKIVSRHTANDILKSAEIREKV